MQNIVLNKASFCPSRPFFGENPGVVNIFHVRNLGPCQSMQTQDSEELENKIHKRSMSAFISFEKCITDISVSCILEQTVSQSINCKFFTDCFSSIVLTLTDISEALQSPGIVGRLICIFGGVLQVSLDHKR